MNLEKTREWVQTQPRIKEEERRLIEAALDSFEVLRRARKISPGQLVAITEAARCRWVAGSDIGGRALAALACKHAAAQQAFRDLVGSRKSHERYQAISRLSERMPKPLLQELLTRGLNDRSKAVRLWAAHKCDTLRLAEMVPEMARRAASEPDAGVKHKLEFHAAMIRDGYLVERKRGGRLTLCVRSKYGWNWQDISQQDLESGRIPALVAEEQSRSY
jgi:hypothetical protein